MEAERPSRQPAMIVAFDFDGTMTVRDSYSAFLRWRVGQAAYAAGLAAMAPAVIAYLAHRDRGRLKAVATRQFLLGRPLALLEREAEDFCAAHWARMMRPDAMACWNDWGAKGAHRVIVTASPAVTVAPFAQRLGAEALIGTRLAVDSQGLITGAFASPNCRGQEKVDRLRAAYGEDLRLAAAYGDTSGDREMLEIADHKGWRQFKRRP